MKIDELNQNTTSFDYINDMNMDKLLDVFEDDNGYFHFNLLKKIKFPADINPIYYKMYTPIDHESFQTISYKFYGTIRLWWLICAANHLLDITDGARKELPLKILDPTYVLDIVNGLKD